MANVIAFFLQMTLPAVANVFVFVPPLVLFRPWTVVTYMFLHGGLMHIAFNMLGLFFFGIRVEDRIGSRRFTILYFLSGITGAVAQLLFAPSAPMIGASAGVFGVMMAFAHFWPDTPIHIWGVIPVPARMLVIITTVLAIWSGFGGARSGIAHFAHLGGYAGAYLYLLWLDRSRAAFKRQAVAPPPTVTRRLEGWRSIDLSTVHEVNRDEVNRILDKIGATGVASLTPQEKTFLSNFAPPES
jgi:membrane associated rhomboid family serine protease